MTWSDSAMFEFAVLQLMKKAGQNLSADNYAAALFLAAATPDNTPTTVTNTEYGNGQWVSANEVPTSGSYTNGAGGLAIPAADLSLSQITGTGLVLVCSIQPQWTGVTWLTTNAPNGLLFFDTSASNAGLSFHWFGAPAPVNGGNFTVQWSSSPVAGSVDLIAC